MPTIEENGLYVVIVETEVDPTQQQAFINALADQLEQHVKDFPGFVSASFHASEDGQRVFNYAQWRSKEAYESFLESDPPDIKEVVSRYGAELLKINHPLRVVRVIENK